MNIQLLYSAIAISVSAIGYKWICWELKQLSRDIDRCRKETDMTESRVLNRLKATYEDSFQEHDEKLNWLKKHVEILESNYRSLSIKKDVEKQETLVKVAPIDPKTQKDKNVK